MTSAVQEQEPIWKRIYDAINLQDHRNIRDPYGFSTLGQRWQDKTIGKEWREGQMADVWDLLPDEWKPGVAEWGKGMAEKFGTAWMDARTLEGKEWLDPGKIAAAGTARTLEAIGIPFELLAQATSQATGLDIELSRIAADFIPVGGVASKLSKAVNKGKLLKRTSQISTIQKQIDHLDSLVRAKKFRQAREFAEANEMRVFFHEGFEELSRLDKIKEVFKDSPLGVYTSKLIQKVEKTLKPVQQQLFDPKTVTTPLKSRGGIDSSTAAAGRILADDLARYSGYQSLRRFKSEILNKWPQKEVDQLFRDLNEAAYREGYVEHLVAKSSKKGRIKRALKDGDVYTKAKSSSETFDMDWYWDADYIDDTGKLKQGLNKGDRDGINNVRILYNDRFANFKNIAEQILYGTEGKPGIGVRNPNLAQRVVIDVEDIQKRLSIRNRQNPGDLVIKRAGTGEVIGNLGQYLEALYPQSPAAKRVFLAGLRDLGITTDAQIAAFRRMVIEKRINGILNNTHKLPKNKVARKRYILDKTQKDMSDLYDQYPFLPPQEAIFQDINTPGSGMTDADFNLRNQPKGPIPTKGKTIQGIFKGISGLPGGG